MATARPSALNWQEFNAFGVVTFSILNLIRNCFPSDYFDPYWAVVVERPAAGSPHSNLEGGSRWWRGSNDCGDKCNRELPNKGNGNSGICSQCSGLINPNFEILPRLFSFKLVSRDHIKWEGIYHVDWWWRPILCRKDQPNVHAIHFLQFPLIVSIQGLFDLKYENYNSLNLLQGGCWHFN